MIVDFPTPDEPINATVVPSPMCAASSTKPFPSIALTDSTEAPPATVSTSRTRSAARTFRSALLSTIKGRTPLSRARVR